MTFPQPIVEEHTPISDLKNMNKSPNKRNLKTSKVSSKIADTVPASNSSSIKSNEFPSRAASSHSTGIFTRSSHDFVYENVSSFEPSSPIKQLSKFMVSLFVCSSMLFTFAALYPELISKLNFVPASLRQFVISRGNVQTTLAFIGLISASLLVSFTTYKVLRPAVQLVIALIFLVFTPLFAVYILLFVPSFVPPFAQKIVPQANAIFESQREVFYSMCSKVSGCERIVNELVKYWSK